MTESSSSVQIAVCEEHGLKYNAATQSGCVRCRRAQAGAQPDSPAVASTETAPSSLPGQALLAVALVLGTGFVFLGVHRQLVSSFQAMISGGYDTEVPEGGSYVAVGPAQQANQILELQVEMFLEDVKEPEVDQLRREDGELDRLITQLEDPDQRARLSPDQIIAIMSQADQRIYGLEGYEEDEGPLF